MHYVYFEDQLEKQRRLYENPLEIITATTPDEVPAALKRIAQCQNEGLYLAGFCSYELGYVMETKLLPLLPENRQTPLMKFGVFKSYSETELVDEGTAYIGPLEPLWTQAQYQARFEKIMTYIKAGDVYQINLSFPMRGRVTGSAAALYHLLRTKQPVRYGGVVSLGGDDIITLSPELFFEINETQISMRPMKGTAPRGANEMEDKTLANHLQQDDKNRAENLMIVDLLRNDLSRISTPGSVRVSDLFSLETYPSLHTMTSGIEGQLGDVSFEQILRALFPCGSITGAPKIRAMEIINELETGPRGAYCGAVGLIDPDGSMRFNVGIRTLIMAHNICTYPVGSGVVADSDMESEYQECLLKAAFLQDNFDLFESFGWDEQIGFLHEDLHLQRLKKSAKHFGFTYDAAAINHALNACVSDLTGQKKIRLTLMKNGKVQIEAQDINIGPHDEVWPIALSKTPLDRANPLLAHKTTSRDFIDGELKRLSALTGCKEVLFFNQQGELCEGSFTNIFVIKNGQMQTPPVSCGLLPGILRDVLLANGEAVERVLTQEDLRSADEIYIGNSVRGLIRVKLVNKLRQ